ncbi:MAG: P-loop NTPase [Myxococcota bacterium]
MSSTGAPQQDENRATATETPTPARVTTPGGDAPAGSSTGAHPTAVETRRAVPGREIIAVGGGKGGIGKSLLASNMGVHLAQSGRRVVLIDADLGGANLHTFLGIKPPRLTLSDFVSHKIRDLEEVVTPTPIEGLGLISGALDMLGAANPKYTQKLRLLREVARLDVDTVIIDLGGGTSFNILDFFLIADHGILTVVPEPTSIENAYRFIKAAYYRRLKTAEMSWNLRPLVEEAMNDVDGAGMRMPADLVTYVEQRDAEAGARLRAELERFPLKLVVNQTRTEQEEKVGLAISDACRKYFGIPMDFLGAIPFDDAVWQSVRRRRPVILEQPESDASRSIVRITGALGLVS